MLQVGRGPDLAQEPLGADHGRELGPHELDGDLAVVPQVLGEVDSRHAALAELALEAIAFGQRGGEAGAGLVHGCPSI